MVLETTNIRLKEIRQKFKTYIIEWKIVLESTNVGINKKRLITAISSWQQIMRQIEHRSASMSTAAFASVAGILMTNINVRRPIASFIKRVSLRADS
jgi:hypothetical protein